MKRFQILFLTLIGLVFLACNDEPERLSLDEISGEKEAISEVKKIENEAIEELDAIIADSNVIELNHLKFIQDSLRGFEVTSGSKSYKLDRYPTENVEKIAISSGATLLQEGINDLYELHHYQFKDSTFRKTAFYNWLDCFGTKCTSIKLNEDLDKIEAKRTFVITTSDEIYTLESDCGNDVKWKQVKQLITEKIGKKNVRHQFEIDCRKRLKWKQK